MTLRAEYRDCRWQSRTYRFASEATVKDVKEAVCVRQTKHNVLVYGGIHVAQYGVGQLPEFGAGGGLRMGQQQLGHGLTSGEGSLGPIMTVSHRCAPESPKADCTSFTNCRIRAEHAPQLYQRIGHIGVRRCSRVRLDSKNGRRTGHTITPRAMTLDDGGSGSGAGVE